MSLVILLALTATVIHSSHGDVKHVLDGSAQLPQHIHTNDCQHFPAYPFVPGYPQGLPTSPDNAVPGSVAFWWAGENSPFKQAYEYYKKCSEKGNCIPPPGFQVPNPGCGPTGCVAAQSGVIQLKEEHKSDFSKNPFLNGQVPAIPTVGCLDAQCGNNIDLSKNPFLNGNIGIGSNPNAIVIPEPPSKLDFSKNPFLTGVVGQTTFSGNGQAIQTGTNGFLGVQPAQPFGTTFTNIQTSDNQLITGNLGGKLCNGPNDLCVAPELCVNGVVITDGSTILDRRQSNDHCESENKVCCQVPSESSFSTSGSSSSSFGFESSSIPTNFPSRLSENAFLNIKNGQKTVPGSIIKFNGGAGISAGSIQVISDNEAIPNPHVSNFGESGSGVAAISATTDVPIFASTPDYSHDNLNQISFVSTTQGPQYLPPDASPKPSYEVPELIAPSISTYEPIIPTTSRPITKPIVPGPSVVSVYPRPTSFEPSSPQPFIPINYTPKPTPFEILPLLPSSPKPFIPQQPIVIPYPEPHQPIIPQEPVIIPHPPPFIRPEPEITHIYQPSTPLVTFENRIKPSEPPKIPYFPKETPGYSYPTPTPAFSYPSPSTPSPSININNGFIPIKTKPTPKPYRPQPTIGYEYKKPTPSFTFPTPKPFNPQPQPSDEYEYKKPPSVPSLPPVVTSSVYLPPISTPKPYNPQPQPSEGYEYTPPPTIKVTNNQYLPPFETPQPNRIPDGSNTNEILVSKPPPVSSTNGPTHEGQPDIPIPDVVKFPKPQRPSLPQAGCAAALKCVQEIYCTADGIISPVPVILSKAQQLARVPTTECTDREAGIVGRCCRDPNYVDPWPSANSLNGFDDGQYKEDPNLGKYFPQNQRIQRSESRVNGVKTVKAPIRTRSSTHVASETIKNGTCGIRHFNSQPRSSGPIDVTFAEIPWQAMILRDSTRKLLCGGVIVKSNVVLTSAQCLDGIATSDVLIKGGEWKLGIDEEPLPFQIVKVAAIIRHPSYKPGVLQHDLALLVLEEHLRTAKNVAPICLSNTIQPQKQKCIVTGWGKRILQVHLKAAIMRSIDVSILDNKQCEEVMQDRYKESLPNYFKDTICGFSRNDQCDVDYGSALACTNGDGQYTLAGIFSWDTGCKDDGQIGGYIAPDSQWIENTCAKPLNELKTIDKKYTSEH